MLLLVGRKIVDLLGKTTWWFLKKLNRTIVYPRYATDIYLLELKTEFQIGTCTPVFIVALFTIVKSRNNAVPINR